MTYENLYNLTSRTYVTTRKGYGTDLATGERFVVTESRIQILEQKSKSYKPTVVLDEVIGTFYGEAAMAKAETKASEAFADEDLEYDMMVEAEKVLTQEYDELEAGDLAIQKGYNNR